MLRTIYDPADKNSCSLNEQLHCLPVPELVYQSTRQKIERITKCDMKREIKGLSE